MMTIPVSRIPEILDGAKITYSSFAGTLVLADCESATREQRMLMDELDAAFIQAVEDALDAGCLALQNSIGVTSGDLAAMHFCGGQSKDSVTEGFADYFLAELKNLLGEQHVVTDHLIS